MRRCIRWAGALWLRLSAYAYNEIGDYERLAELLPGVPEATGRLTLAWLSIHTVY